MNEKALANLNPVAGNDQPLEAWKFRFYPKSREWRRVSGRTRNRMAVRITRAGVADEIGVPESAIAEWEKTRVKHEASPVDAGTLLRKQSDGTYNSEPLAKWKLCFFTKSRTWRRATASRDEVSREYVAKRVGVTVEELQAWEDGYAEQREAQAA